MSNRKKPATAQRFKIRDDKETARQLRIMGARDRSILGLTDQVAALSEYIKAIEKRPDTDEALITGVLAAAGETRLVIMAIPAHSLKELQAKVTVADDCSPVLPVHGNFETIAAASILADIGRLKPIGQPWLAKWTRH